jgi:hypothetical protein
MRRLAVVLGAALLAVACTDTVAGPASPVDSRGGVVVDDNPMGCTTGTICLEPIIVIGDPGSGDGGGWSGGGGGDGGGGEDPGGHDCLATVDAGGWSVQGCTSGGDEFDPEESTICPQPFFGNVQPALITVAGRNHEFQFHSSEAYPFTRLTGGASPATYKIGLPTTSKDAWWIAESGTITVWCRGAWIRQNLWIGTLTVLDSDLHMVMGPGHPDF